MKVEFTPLSASLVPACRAFNDRLHSHGEPPFLLRSMGTPKGWRHQAGFRGVIMSQWTALAPFGAARCWRECYRLRGAVILWQQRTDNALKSNHGSDKAQFWLPHQEINECWPASRPFRRALGRHREWARHDVYARFWKCSVGPVVTRSQAPARGPVPKDEHQRGAAQPVRAAGWAYLEKIKSTDGCEDLFFNGGGADDIRWSLLNQ